MNEQEKKPINPNAFPISEADYDRYSLELPPWTGMTLRDYFANSAMQGLVTTLSPSDNERLPNQEWIAKISYDLADAMLKKREL